MKDGLGKPAILRLARNLKRADGDFDAEAFTRRCVRGLAKLELKQRVLHVIEGLDRHLPQSFAQSSQILRRAASNWDAGDPSDPLRGFAAWPMIDYVGVRGLKDFDLGMATLHDLTGLFTAEFAIRPFIRDNPERALSTIRKWTRDSDPAVRRLCSEGLRPLLPWGKRVPYLTENPETIVAILDELVEDPSADVRRSVANNINDIGKSHPDLAVQTCRRWLERATPTQREPIERLIKHATRSLVKLGNQGALELLGAATTPNVRVDFSVTPKHLELGGTLTLDARVISKSNRVQKLVIDFIIHHQKANQSTAGKVFKWKVLELPARSSAVLRKRHTVRRITTRKYYSGRHLIEVSINGQRLASAEFTLDVPRQ